MNAAVVATLDSDLVVEIKRRKPLADLVRARILPIVTRRVFNLIQGHFAAYAATHHATADRLGAPHTKHMERAARNMTHETDGERGRVILRMAGVGRAFHDVEIRMKDRRLTIPISKEAYGLTAREAGRKFGEENMIVVRTRKGSLLLAAKQGGRGDRRGGKGKRRGRGGSPKRTIIPLYVLKEKVFQKRDPTMLPDAATIRQTAQDALEKCIGRYIKGGEVNG